MKFSEKIVRLRKIKGITQDEFASAVGVSRQAVYKWESGQSYPEVAKLLEIKLLFGISIDDLLDESYEIALPEKKKRKKLPKTERMAIEEEIKREMENEAQKDAAVPEYNEETKAQPATVAAEAKMSASASMPKPEPVPAELQKTDSKFERKPESEKEAGAKKVGFLGRLFGRK